MSPSSFFLLTLVITAIAAFVSHWLHRRRRRALKNLAKIWQMHFSADDRFRLAGRIHSAIPVPGAADVVVTDVIYGTEHDFYRYLLTAHFTTGVLHSKKRRQRACTLRESKSISAAGDVAYSPPVFAPDDLAILDQYRKLYETEVAGRESVEAVNATAETRRRGDSRGE